MVTPQCEKHPLKDALMTKNSPQHWKPLNCCSDSGQDAGDEHVGNNKNTEMSAVWMRTAFSKEAQDEQKSKHKHRTDHFKGSIQEGMEKKPPLKLKVIQLIPIFAFCLVLHTKIDFLSGFLSWYLWLWVSPRQEGAGPLHNEAVPRPKGGRGLIRGSALKSWPGLPPPPSPDPSTSTSPCYHHIRSRGWTSSVVCTSHLKHGEFINNVVGQFLNQTRETSDT